MNSKEQMIPGIVGGVGPEAAASFYLRILEAAKETNNQVRPAVLMASVSLPLEAEKAFLAGEKNTEPIYIDSIIKSVRRLEQAGADFLAVPSNTVCLLLESIQGATTLDVMDPISVTITEVKKREMASVEILGTSSLVSSDVYGKKLRSHNIQVLYPEAQRQKEVDRIIRCLVDGTHTPSDITALDKIIQTGLEGEADGVVIGCTDLHLVFAKRAPEPRVIDSLTVLAAAVAKKSSPL